MKEKFILRDRYDIHLVRREEIVWCQASDCYTIVYLVDGRKLTVSKSLKKVEDELLPHKFIRISQSSLINSEHLQSIGKKEKTIILANNHKVQYTIQLKKLLVMISDSKSYENEV